METYIVRDGEANFSVSHRKPEKDFVEVQMTMLEEYELKLAEERDEKESKELGVTKIRRNVNECLRDVLARTYLRR